MQNPIEVQLAAKALLARLPERLIKLSPPVGIVLGTGLSFLADKLASSDESRVISFADLPAFPHSSVKSHAGKFFFGTVEGIPVLAQAGRFHLYEGYSPEQVCMGVRTMGMLGIKTMILTNSAGAINPLFKAGSLLCISDIINNTGLSPLTGPNHDLWGERFPDMGEVFSKRLRQIACETALARSVPLEQGIYLAVHGPELETPAETRMYRLWGADAVGMSTALEAIACIHMGMNLLGFSCLTNQNLPDCLEKITLDEILLTAEKCGEHLGKLIWALLPALYREQQAAIAAHTRN